MNVLLLTADSLRADRTSLFGHRRDTTPFLSEFADDAFEFRRAYANGRNTAASFPAVHTSTHQRYFTGLGIPEHGTPTLAERLDDEGYRTCAIHTNELLSREYNYGRGFDVYEDSRSDDRGASSGSADGWRSLARDAIGDGVLFEAVKRAHFLSTEHLGIKIFDTADAVSGFEDRILEWATASDGDWFIWAHYMNPHHPYEPPGECQEALGLDPVPERRATRLSRKMRLHPDQVSASERETLRGLYDASVLSWDREVASTYRSLSEAGELSETLVIVTADHGELLGEGGRYGHPPALDQELLRVPMLWSGPVEAGRSERQVGLIDIAPTVLTLAGIEVPGEYQGRALFDSEGGPCALDPEVQLAETGSEETDSVCAIDGDRKVVRGADGGEWRSYELSEEALRERPTDDPFADLRDAVTEHLDRAARNKQRGADIDQDALESDLAALGYLEE